MTHRAMMYDEGVFASRPAASVGNGYVYFATDTGNLYRSNGSTWTLIGSTGAGTGIPQGGPLTADLDFDGFEATNAADPTAAQSLVTRAYGDANYGGAGGIGAVLFDSTLGADTASIDTGAGAIAGGYHVIQLVITARTDDASAIPFVDLTVNNDSSAIYDQVLSNSNAGAGGFSTSVAQTRWQFRVHGGGGSANYAAGVHLTIPGYADTTFWKAGSLMGGLLDATSGNAIWYGLACGYRSTAAISRAKLAAQGAAKLKAGSRLTVLGW